MTKSHTKYIDIYIPTNSSFEACRQRQRAGRMRRRTPRPTRGRRESPSRTCSIQRDPHYSIQPRTSPPKFVTRVYGLQLQYLFTAQPSLFSFISFSLQYENVFFPTKRKHLRSEPRVLAGLRGGAPRAGAHRGATRQGGGLSTDRP